jgi:hypothetical protein
MVADALRWTTRDLQAMPDDGGWKRYEIIAGDLFVTGAPHFRHQRVAARLQSQLAPVVALLKTDTLTSPLLRGFSLCLADIF